jgi:hypothetical protein
MKNLIALLIALFLISCEKESTVSTEYTAQARPLYPQNPLSPQVVVSNPVPFQRVTDTFHLKFSATAGRTWWGGPDNLSAYRVNYDGKVIDTASINGKSFSKTLIVNTGADGVHSIGVTFFSKSTNVGSQGFYISKF